MSELSLAGDLDTTGTQCKTTLWNGTEQIVTCGDVSTCNGKDYNGVTCTWGNGPTMSCRRVCNAAHQVTGVECICVCTQTVIEEPNCPPVN